VLETHASAVGFRVSNSSCFAPVSVSVYQCTKSNWLLLSCYDVNAEQLYPVMVLPAGFSLIAPADKQTEVCVWMLLTSSAIPSVDTPASYVCCLPPEACLRQ